MKKITILRFIQNNPNDLKSKILTSGFWLTFSNTVVKILQFIRSIILARLLTPEIFGIWGIVSLVRQGIEVFTNTGFGTELIHRQKQIKEASDIAWTLNVVRGFILMVLCFVFAPLVAKFYHKPILEILLKAIAVTFFINGLRNINIILLKKELNFKKIAIQQQISALLGLVVTLTLAYLYRNVWALVWGTIAFFITDLITSYIIQPKYPKLYYNKKLAKEIFKYGIFISGGGIVVFITTELDNAVVGKILGMKWLGFYVLAYTLANLPATEITHVVSGVMFPAYSQLQNNIDRLRNLYLKTLRIVATFSIPAAAGLAFLAPDILRFIYGEKWLPATNTLRILCIFGAIRSLGATTGPIYNAIGKPNITFFLNFSRLILIVLLIYPLSIKYGIIGTAYSIVIPAIILQFFSWNILKRVLNIKLFNIITAIIGPVFASIIMLFAIYYFSYYILSSVQSIWNLFIVIIFAIFVYILAYFSYMKFIPNPNSL